MPKLSSKKSNKAFLVNSFLLVIILVTNFLILWGMFGPRVSLAVETATQDTPKIEEEVKKKPTENRLIIPSIRLNEKINEGSTYDALIDGAWRRPATSTPELGGNTVLAGHRFTYQGASIFYNLDKVKINDEIAMTYDGNAYKYKVSDIKIVDPSNPTIEQNTEKDMLTLYTCTPLWTTEQRLVVIADLIKDAN